MPCQVVGNAIVCSRSPRRRRCAYCQEWSKVLCDHRLANGKTCDVPLCRRHALHVAPNTDYCPTHRVAHQEPA